MCRCSDGPEYTSVPGSGSPGPKLRTGGLMNVQTADLLRKKRYRDTVSRTVQSANTAAAIVTEEANQYYSTVSTTAVLLSIKHCYCSTVSTTAVL